MLRVPPGMTEEQVLAEIDKQARLLSPTFAFGIYGQDDIEQEARLFGVRGMDKYEAGRPLANFLYTHIRNRLLNLWRDKLRRSDPPCRPCHAGHFCKGDQPCKKYATWRDRNDTKANLQSPLGLETIGDHFVTNDRPDDEVSRKELLAIIDEKLDVSLRGDYLRMRSGVSLSKCRRKRVEDAVLEILSWPKSAD